MTLSNDYHVPIGTSAPTHAQITATGPGDIEFNVFSGTTSLLPISPYSTISPYSNDVPTYQGCEADTDEDSVSGSQGTTFCLYEESAGLVVGGVVTYINQSQINPGTVEVQFTVWSNPS